MLSLLIVIVAILVFLSYIYINTFFSAIGAMLNIVQDSALLEAIGCQMEMVRSIPRVICQRISTSDFM